MILFLIYNALHKIFQCYTFTLINIKTFSHRMPTRINLVGLSSIQLKNIIMYNEKPCLNFLFKYKIYKLQDFHALHFFYYIIFCYKQIQIKRITLTLIY